MRTYRLEQYAKICCCPARQIERRRTRLSVYFDHARSIELERDYFGIILRITCYCDRSHDLQKCHATNTTTTDVRLVQHWSLQLLSEKLNLQQEISLLIRCFPERVHMKVTLQNHSHCTHSTLWMFSPLRESVLTAPQHVAFSWRYHRRTLEGPVV
jgi:hypothetical protein